MKYGESLSSHSHFHSKRNQARQKLSTLPDPRFRDLAGDVLSELERRNPHLAESTANSRVQPVQANQDYTYQSATKIQTSAIHQPASNYQQTSMNYGHTNNVKNMVKSSSTESLPVRHQLRDPQESAPSQYEQAPRSSSNSPSQQKGPSQRLNDQTNNWPRPGSPETAYAVDVSSTPGPAAVNNILHRNMQFTPSLAERSDEETQPSYEKKYRRSSDYGDNLDQSNIGDFDNATSNPKNLNGDNNIKTGDSLTLPSSNTENIRKGSLRSIGRLQVRSPSAQTEDLPSVKQKNPDSRILELEAQLEKAQEEISNLKLMQSNTSPEPVANGRLSPMATRTEPVEGPASVAKSETTENIRRQITALIDEMQAALDSEREARNQLHSMQDDIRRLESEASHWKLKYEELLLNSGQTQYNENKSFTPSQYLKQTPEQEMRIESLRILESVDSSIEDLFSILNSGNKDEIISASKEIVYMTRQLVPVIRSLGSITEERLGHVQDELIETASNVLAAAEDLYSSRPGGPFDMFTITRAATHMKNQVHLLITKKPGEAAAPPAVENMDHRNTLESLR